MKRKPQTETEEEALLRQCRQDMLDIINKYPWMMVAEVSVQAFAQIGCLSCDTIVEAHDFAGNMITSVKEYINEIFPKIADMKTRVKTRIDEERKKCG